MIGRKFNMTSAKVIADSISPDGIRLTTLQLRYPRMVHADFMTHRVFSRNGRSSRAVPFSTLVKEDPYVPHFKKNQPGMVASEELSDEQFALAEEIWLTAADVCKTAAKGLHDLGVHKQWVNRMLEWFGYIDVLVTSTDWANFFELRLDGGAQPEIIQLADCMQAAIDGSTPHEVKPGEWHLPYITFDDFGIAGAHLDETNPGWDRNISHDQEAEAILEVLKKISVARCARLTIKPFDGDGSFEKELKRYELLMESRPVHASPAEHIATPDIREIYYHDSGVGGVEYEEVGDWKHSVEHGNFYGWRQFRKMIPHNTIYDR